MIYIKHDKAMRVRLLTIECQLEDGAGNFEALARRSGIKVSYPAQETAENHHGATASTL